MTKLDLLLQDRLSGKILHLHPSPHLAGDPAFLTTDPESPNPETELTCRIHSGLPTHYARHECSSALSAR